MYMVNKKNFKLIFFSIHFFLYYFLRMLFLLIFLNFCFFHGDLRLLLKCLPISLIIWLLSFIDYYFEVFIEGNLNYIKTCLNITLKTNASIITDKQNFQEISLDNFIFELTPFAFREKFTVMDYPQLISNWEELSTLQVYFFKYKKFLIFFQHLFFVCYFLVLYFIYTSWKFARFITHRISFYVFTKKIYTF